ncbi:MAG: histidinol-phosphate transaminase [Clostridia bacterium]|nr:histidinol-phosphate transaminase [Clostridia bacterium]
MSRFMSKKYASLVPYTPGEQPKERKYLKLNTNESPFPPSEKAIEYASEAAKSLQLYSDPECTPLHSAFAKMCGVSEDMVLATNGSDEILNFAFMAFCDAETPAVFADITYGFYKVFADINNLPSRIIPLGDDFTIKITDYFDAKGTIFIANPNAPTGIALSRDEIEQIIIHNPENVVVIDEAYVDFGGESCIPLLNKYDNLLVTQTFSKSRSMAGARLGFGIGSPSLMADLKTVKYSTNPYNINSMTMAAGVGQLLDDEYTRKNCLTIAENREFLTKELEKLGFTVLPSKTNFVFAKSDKMEGGELYRKLRERGILVRHFTSERISAFNRITVGTREQMETLLLAINEILDKEV